jgi:hypothetical protein
MPSKLLRLSLTIIACASFSACTVKLNDKVEKAPVRVGVGCLSDASTVFARFADGSIEEGQLDRFFDCSEKAFNTFYNNTEGVEKDSYKATELSWFLSKYFLKRPIPAPLLEEAMVLWCIARAPIR